jgi:hypothetical protein
MVRVALGPLFPLAGNVYRRVFMDIHAVARCVPRLPNDALLLDVGGGDGAILNPLLDLQPTLRVTAIDIAPEIGQLVRPDLRSRVTLHPGTSVREYIDMGGQAPDALFISDVFHHVAPEMRTELIRDLLDVFAGKPPVIVVKDVAPQGVRSRLGFWADRNISGDRELQPVSPGDVAGLLKAVDPDLQVSSTPLISVDFPNFCLVFSKPAQGDQA